MSEEKPKELSALEKEMAALLSDTQGESIFCPKWPLARSAGGEWGKACTWGGQAAAAPRQRRVLPSPGHGSSRVDACDLQTRAGVLGEAKTAASNARSVRRKSKDLEESLDQMAAASDQWQSLGGGTRLA